MADPSPFYIVFLLILSLTRSLLPWLLKALQLRTASAHSASLFLATTASLRCLNYPPQSLILNVWWPSSRPTLARQRRQQP
jgi:hypothetical protein